MVEKLQRMMPRHKLINIGLDSENGGEAAKDNAVEMEIVTGKY